MDNKVAGTPIKDRGIRWVETYGDKSAYLKQEFEQQVGQGSYFRWEGHDSTTGTDYYVVVSPGYSKEHGYHFFAGLRKMPANQGASGKKFGTQREAMGYAIDKWRTPPPQTKPGKPYTADDLVGKEIVMEGVHTSAAEGFMVKESGLVEEGGNGFIPWMELHDKPTISTKEFCEKFDLPIPQEPVQQATPLPTPAPVAVVPLQPPGANIPDVRSAAAQRLVRLAKWLGENGMKSEASRVEEILGELP
jgi:hypothetical protein